jgi:hypothetical protein
MAARNSLATISPPPISKQPVSSSEASIRQFLVQAGEVYGRIITSALTKIWVRELGGYSVEQLDGMFRRALRTCKFFPTIANVLEPVEDSPVPRTNAGMKWQGVLEYVSRYYSADLPGCISQGAPRISERTMTAICAAGGLTWIADCSREDLQWAQKRFIESYIAWETLERDQYLLPEGSPVKALISGVAACKALPATPPRGSLRSEHEQTGLGKEQRE